MENSRLCSLLHTFDRKECRELRKFISTPFFNQRQDVIDLFELLMENSEAGLPAPSKETAFQKLYGKSSTYDDHKVRMVMSFLLKLAERYLVHREFFSDDVRVKTALAGLYRRRNLPKHFERTMREASTLQSGSDFRSYEFFQKEHQLQLERYRFTVSVSERRITEMNLQAVTDNLDIAYFSQKILQACMMVAHQTVYPQDYDFGLLDAILRRVESNGLLEVPAISVYYFCYRALTEPEVPKWFARLKQALLEEMDGFPPQEVADLYQLAVNFCVKRYNEGSKAYLADQFDLYGEGLARGSFLNNGVLSRFTFRNVVTVGLVMRNFDRVEQFIHNYRDRLEERHRQSTFSFSLARLEYERRNYRAALQMLQQSEYRDLLLNLAAKTVMLKIYFETDEFDALDSHLGAMQRFIRRKNIIGYHRENYLKLIQFVRKLMEAVGREELATLHKEVTETKSVAEREWLLVQCGAG